MKKFKLILALALVSLIVVMAAACTKNNSLEDDKQENNTDVEKPIEDENPLQDDAEPEEQETPVTIDTDDTDDTIDNKDKDEDETFAETDPKKIIEATSEQVIDAISNKDIAALSEFVHPDKGLRFTPYTFVSLETDIVFSKDEMKGFFEDTEEYLWGHYDGTGDEIKLTPSKYYESYIYSEDFKNAPEIGYNEVLSFGNALENQFEVYESPIVVEYYFPGFDEQYEGMDWRSLRLVFEEYADGWKLVGIIHNQWTI
jgi:hypothetical protein